MGAATIARDITKNKRAEEALRRSEERFKLIEENIDEVFWISDPDISEITYISPAYERVWGRTRKSLLENPKSHSSRVSILTIGNEFFPTSSFKRWESRSITNTA